MAALALAAFAIAAPASPRAHACTLTPEQTRVVAKVTTADTLTLDDGTGVVLIGALPPVAGHDATLASWPPTLASRQALETLTLGQSVGLAFAGRRRDRYGRHLAHVFLERDGQRVWVQANLIASGHARAYALPGNTACLEHLLDHERSARQAKTGHWATGVFQDHDAHDPRAIARYRDTFQTIEGRVARVASVGSQTVLDFGPDHRHGFSVWLPHRNSHHTAATANLTGQRVRVRGWIELRRTPRLTLSSPTEIEPLSAPNPPDEAQASSPRP